MTVDAVDHLNTTRIHRLLRPLRSKCTALSTAYSVPSQHKPSVSTTYSKLSRRPYRRPHNDAVPLPLTVLQYPENLRTNSEWHLSQKIKEIQDTFRNLVRVAQYSIPPNECGRSTRSLAAMCAVIVGDNIHSDIQVYQEFEGGAVDVNGDISTEISDQIYELVPPHYRGYVHSHRTSRSPSSKCVQQLHPRFSCPSPYYGHLSTSPCAFDGPSRNLSPVSHGARVS